MSASKSIILDNEVTGGTISIWHDRVAERGVFLPRHRLWVQVTEKPGEDRNIAETVLVPEDAKELGEWLIAWAKEHTAPSATCCLCKSPILMSEGKALGQELAHQKCLDAQWRKGKP